MLKNLLLSSIVLLSSSTFAKDNYFYFWAESYESMVEADGTTFVNVKLKTGESGNYDLSVNEKIVAKDYFILEDEITEFPIVISKKYTSGKKVTVCALKQDKKVEFQNQICLDIQLVK